MKNSLVRNSVFILLSLIFYVLWMKGGEQVYGKVVEFGIDKITSRFSAIDNATLMNFPVEKKNLIFCKYSDRTTKISVEYCLPIVLLLAWNISLFFDKRLVFKISAKWLTLNFFVVYFLQIIFPLLLFNISTSKIKSMSLFIGLQVFGFLVFFLILKDSFLLKYYFPQNKNDKKE